jgi:hypothetical protein
MITQEIERQLLIECIDQKNIYVEFNIAAKLQGSFEEQGATIRLLVGRPVMTPNEARGRLNLPRITDDPTADQLAPQQGGPSTTQQEAVTPQDTENAADDTVDKSDPNAEPADETATLIAQAIDVTRRRQYAALSSKPEAARSSIFFDQIDRWNRELAADLAPLVGVNEARRVAEYANAETYLALDRMGEEVA